MIKNIALVFAGVIGAAAIPSIASTASETVTLTPGQIEFIRQVDKETNSNFSNLSSNPGSVQIIKSASVACGNVEFQKQFIYSAGGSKIDAEYASKKFETLFCGNNP